MKTRRGRQYVAAMVLGTALSTLGTAGAARAEAGISEDSIANVSRYCTSCWRNARVPVDRWGDCTQDVFGRLLDRVDHGAWNRLLAADSEERRELIRAIDAVKKRTLRDCRRSSSLQTPVADDRDALLRQRGEQRQVVEQAATRLLSARQQRIMQLSFAGGSVGEVARDLAMPVERVSDEKYKAIRKLREYFRQAKFADVG
jgi:RNA polymerase sigma factor (sigma-70 family)